MRARIRGVGIAEHDSADQVDEILQTAASAKLLDAMEENLLLAPIQSTRCPAPPSALCAESRHEPASHSLSAWQTKSAWARQSKPD